MNRIFHLFSVAFYLIIHNNSPENLSKLINEQRNRLACLKMSMSIYAIIIIAFSFERNSLPIIHSLALKHDNQSVVMMIIDWLLIQFRSFVGSHIGCFFFHPMLFLNENSADSHATNNKL